MIETRDPFTGEIVARLPEATALDVERALSAARESQAGWAALPLEKRLACLDRWRSLLFRERATLARTISRETGKPVAEAMAAEVATSLDMIRYYVRHAPELLRPRTTGSATLAILGKQITTTCAPWGVAALISPWNYPLLLPVGQLAPLLAAGNAVVHKPSELTAGTAQFVHDLLREAGVPAPVAGVVHGGGAVGQALVGGDVDKAFFTGSLRVGRQVAATCAARLVPCSLELGGSDAALVLDDANLTLAARGIAWGRFTNAGQTCVAAKRVFVMAAVADAFIEALRQEVRALHHRAPGDETWDIGPLIRASDGEALEVLLADDEALGARIERHRAADPASLPFAPALVLDVPADARCLREETFGPVLPIVRVSDVDEAVARANATPYGLSASVWSRSRRRAHDVARRLASGTVVINDVALVAGIAEASHGGFGASGYGRAHGVGGLMEAVRTRTIVDDRIPRRRQPWWFPYGPGVAAAFDRYTALSHGTSLRQRLDGLRAALGLLRRS